MNSLCSKAGLSCRHNNGTSPEFCRERRPRSLPVGLDVVEDDEAAVTNEGAVCQEISERPGIAVVAVDEEHVELVSVQKPLDSRDCARVIGRAVDQMNRRAVWNQSAQPDPIPDEEIDGDDLRRRSKPVGKQEVRPARSRSDLADALRSERLGEFQEREHLPFELLRAIADRTGHR